MTFSHWHKILPTYFGRNGKKVYNFRCKSGLTAYFEEKPNPIFKNWIHFFAKSFLFSKKLYMLQYINAGYYPHHPNMMVKLKKTGYMLYPQFSNLFVEGLIAMKFHLLVLRLTDLTLHQSKRIDRQRTVSSGGWYEPISHSNRTTFVLWPIL